MLTSSLSERSSEEVGMARPEVAQRRDLPAAEESARLRVDQARASRGCPVAGSRRMPSFQIRSARACQRRDVSAAAHEHGQPRGGSQARPRRRRWSRGKQPKIWSPMPAELIRFSDSSMVETRDARPSRRGRPGPPARPSARRSRRSRGRRSCGSSCSRPQGIIAVWSTAGVSHSGTPSIEYFWNQ